MAECFRNLSFHYITKTLSTFCLGAILSYLLLQLSCEMDYFNSTLNSESASQCHTPRYETRILMYEPFMMHIENFISADERAHLLELGYARNFISEKLTHDFTENPCYSLCKSFSRTGQEVLMKDEPVQAHSSRGLITLSSLS